MIHLREHVPDHGDTVTAALHGDLLALNDLANANDCERHLLDVLDRAPHWTVRFRAAELLRDHAATVDLLPNERGRFIQRACALARDSIGQWFTARDRKRLLDLDPERDRRVNDVPTLLSPWFAATVAEVAALGTGSAD